MTGTSRLLVLLLVLVTGCDAPCIAPDARETAPHDLVTNCDPTWWPAGGSPGLCEFACWLRPSADPRRCTGDRPCIDATMPCTFAMHPTQAPTDCAATFALVDGRRACCNLRRLPVTPPLEVPTLYVCAIE